MILLSASRSRQFIIFDNFFHVNASRSQIRSPVGTAEEPFATLKTLRNRTAGRRTQDGRMTKKCRARMCTSGLVRHFSSFCRPEYVFQPTCCVRSLYLLRDITLLRVGSILTYCKRDLSSVEFLFAFSLIPFLFPPCRTFYTSSKLQIEEKGIAEHRILFR